MAVKVGLPDGDTLLTRSGPEGSSRSNRFERRGQVGRIRHPYVVTNRLANR